MKLPTFTDGPHYMHKRQQDVMSYIRKYGQDSSLLGQDPQDHPDRGHVFSQKLLEMLKSKHNSF